jgi:3-oxoacyl-[acyl-carrier protein] reductase
MEHCNDLRNKRVLITGGSAGIGLATARALKDRGAKLALVARTEGRLVTAAEHLDAIPIVADVGREEDVVRAVREAAEAMDGLDVAINNAAVYYSQPVETIRAESFRRLLEVNVIGPALVTREALPHFRRAGGGDVVNISSTSGLRGGAGSTAYTASKFALRGMSECWQAELRKENVRVILVNPSEVQTRFTGGGREAAPNPHKLYAQDIAHAIVAALEMHPRGFIPELTVFATNPWRAG